MGHTGDISKLYIKYSLCILCCICVIDTQLCIPCILNTVADGHE